MPKGKSEPQEIRFWRFVRKTRGCWYWTGSISPKGYGTFGLDGGKDFYAHRASWMFANKRSPDGLVVMHSCDNRSCVNPSHLALGSVSQNQQDMARKFRTRSNLSAADVRAIRASSDSYRTLAARYGLKSHKTIGEIKRRRIFSHVG